MKHKTYIGFGSNLGNRKKNIEKALGALEKKCEIKMTSGLYETEPVGYANQNNFLNGVILIETNLSPEELLVFINKIEKKLKRTREIKNGPRTIDLDILFFDNLVIKQKNLAIPHPRLHERLFVLAPFCEINPDFIHPVFKKSIKKLKAKLD